MTAFVEETILTEDGVQLVFGETPDVSGSYALNLDVVGSTNHEAAAVETEALAAFLELICGVDPDYIDAPAQRIPEAPVMNWEEVGMALAESQAMLATMQEFLSAILADHGVEHPENVRIYEDANGMLRMVGEHDRQEELEGIINSPLNTQLHELYRAVTAGMSLAGSLVGAGALPEEVRRNAATGASAA